MHNGKIFKENICQKQKKQKGNVLQGSKSWDEGAHSKQSVGDKLKCLAGVLKVRSGAPTRAPQANTTKMLLVSLTLTFTLT